MKIISAISQTELQGEDVTDYGPIKIYDFLPGHLKNSELETIFETTLERVFSKGDMEKVRAYVGRKEKGINSEQDIYLSFIPSTCIYT